MFASDKGEHFTSFLSNRAIRIVQGISDFKNKEIFSKLLNENKKEFLRSLALNASRSPIETFRHGLVPKGWYLSGPVQYRVSANIFNATASLFKGFSFNQGEQTLGVIPKKDQFFTGEVFRDEVNDRLYRVSQLIAHVNSVDCYLVHPVEIESIVHDFMVKGSSPLGIDAGCSGGAGNTGCYLGLNWEPVQAGQDPASAGAMPINLYGINVFLGAYVHGEVGFSANIKVIGTSSIDFHLSYGYTAQVGFSLSEINIDEIVLFSKCFGIPKLYYEVKILTKKFAVGVSICGDLAVTNLRFLLNRTLTYKRTFTARTAKHFAITSKGPRTYPEERDIQNLFDSNIRSGDGGGTDFSNKITLEFTPEIRLYGKLEITFASKPLIDLRVGVALGTPFHFTLDTKLCTAPSLLGNIAVVFRAFVSFEKLKVLGYTLLPGFSESKEIFRIDSIGKIEAGGDDISSDKCFVSSSQNSFELNPDFMTGIPADLMIVQVNAVYWENQEIGQTNRWLGTFPIYLNTYLSVTDGEFFVNSLSFGSVTVQAENDMANKVEIDRIVVVHQPAPNYVYYFQIVDSRISPENVTQSHGKPFESDVQFSNIISQNRVSRIKVNDSHIINVVSNTFPSNETIFGKETPPLKEQKNTYGDLLPKAFGMFKVSSKAIRNDKFTVIQHNDTTPYICDPNVFYIDSLSLSMQDFEMGKFTFPEPIFPKFTPFDYIHASGKALININWEADVTSYNHNWEAMKIQALTIVFKQVNKISKKVLSTSSIQLNLRLVSRTQFFSSFEFDSNQLTNMSGFPAQIDFESCSLDYTISIEGFTCQTGNIEREKLYANDFKITFNLKPEDLPRNTFCIYLGNNGKEEANSRVCAFFSQNSGNYIDLGFTSIATSQVAFLNIDNIRNARRIVAQLFEMNYTENEKASTTSFSFLDGAAYGVLKLKVGEKLQGQNRLVLSCEIDYNPLCEFSWISRDTVVITLEEGVTKFTQQQIIQIPIRFTGFTGVSAGSFHAVVRFRIYRLFYGIGNTICSPFSIISGNVEGSGSGDFGCVEHPRTNDSYAAETHEVELQSSFTFDNIEDNWRLNCWSHSFINKTEVTIIQTDYLFPEDVPYMALNTLGNAPVTIRCSRCSAIQNGKELIPVTNGIAIFKPKVDNISAICESVDSQYCISKLLLGDSKQAFLIQYEKQGLVVDVDESNYSFLDSFIDQQIVYDRSNLNLYKDWAGNVSFQPINLSDQLIVTIKVVLVSANTVELIPFLNGLKIPFSHQKYSDAIILSNQFEEQSNSDENSTVFSFTNEFLDNLYFQGYADNSEFTFQANGSILGPAFYFKGNQDSSISSDLFDLPNNYDVSCVCFEIENHEIRCKSKDSSSSSSTALIVSLVVIGAILVVGAGVVLFFFFKKKFSNDDQGEFEKDI